ncbi:MAG: DUF2029 domain-containing protein [Nannocystis sp.]|uniref:glycosyltransferase 87 family protein n=1 Tax=Nannocystis sp. TaxID=1962667 RepID=UPI002422E540|nr:glycosyltransferase 87 family protein [Nannocystis sp.]MBK9752214.1 DUF2029 domain-containing protein [Nannocystis sp.]
MSVVWARRGVLALAGLWVVVLAICFGWRIGFALELEWMEGGSLHQALRLQQGLAIYPEPSAEFVPFLYTPLYTALLAMLGWALPLDFALARVVSVAACVAVGLGLWRLVGQEGKPRAHQAAAVGLWCSGYVFSFRWYDVGRADSLFLALLLWGLVLLRGARGRPRRAALAGLLVALAFWTKQTAAVFVLASGLLGLLVAPRELLWFAATIAVVDGGGVLLGQRITGGQLWAYIYELHQSHAFNAERFTRKTWGMFGHAAPFLALLLVGRFAGGIWGLARGTGVKGQVDRRGLIYWGVLMATALLVSALGYSTQWAEPNAFMPGVCFGAAFVAVVLPVGRGEAAALGLVAAQLVFALLLEPRYQAIQERGLRAGFWDSYAWQDPARTLPDAGQRGRAAALREELRAAGPTLALQRPWWSVLAGGPGHVGSMGIHDVAPTQQRAIERELAARVEAGVYVALYFDGEAPAWLRSPLQRRYTLARTWRGEERVLPMTGYMSAAGMVTPWRGPQLVYLRREASPK